MYTKEFPTNFVLVNAYHFDEALYEQIVEYNMFYPTPECKRAFPFVRPKDLPFWVTIRSCENASYAL